jgi:HPt (histidine-containing phosphotransfer) domain-containing protein
MSESAGSDAIDRAFLARFTRGDSGLEREILELFARQMPACVAQLRNAATSRAWHEAAHGIKGAALAVGAHRLAALAQEAEGLDFDAASPAAAARRQQSASAVAAATEEACTYIACLFATA